MSMTMAVTAFQAINIPHIRIANTCHIRERAGTCSFYNLAIENKEFGSKSELYPRGESIQLRHVTITQALQALVGDQIQEGQGSQAWACIILIIQVRLYVVIKIAIRP